MVIYHGSKSKLIRSVISWPFISLTFVSDGKRPQDPKKTGRHVITRWTLDPVITRVVRVITPPPGVKWPKANPLICGLLYKGAPFKSIYNHHCWGPLCNRHINKSGQSFQKNPSSYFCEVHFWGIFPYLSPPFLSGWTGQAEQTGEWNWADYLVAMKFALWESHEVRQSKESIDISHFEPEELFPEHTRGGLDGREWKHYRNFGPGFGAFMSCQANV